MSSLRMTSQTIHLSKTSLVDKMVAKSPQAVTYEALASLYLGMHTEREVFHENIMYWDIYYQVWELN